MIKKSFTRILIAISFAFPTVLFRILSIHPDPIIMTIVFGAGIVVAAVMLSWAAEAAQIDISASFAVAILALIAVLPEYAVDLYFAFTAGSKPEFTHYAAANMTGSNRLLIGIGWPVVVFTFVLARRLKKQKVSQVILEPKAKVELAFLGIACIYSLIIPFLKKIALFDSFVLIFLFFLYMFKVSSQEQKDPDLIGVPAGLKSLTKIQRFITVNSMFLIAGGLVYMSAQPFADSLLEMGRIFKINEFLLVQWIAPSATEAPELIVAVIYAYRNKSSQAMGTLLSSKINQWTLLVGSLPVAYMIGGGGLSLPLDIRQNEEFVLTAAQSILGFAFIMNLKLSLRDSIILLSLFLIQFLFVGTNVRIILSVLYVIIALFIIIIQRKKILPISKSFISSTGRN